MTDVAQAESLTPEQLQRVEDLCARTYELNLQIREILGDESVLPGNRRSACYCHRCGYIWFSQLPNHNPQKCPRCKSRGWWRDPKITARTHSHPARRPTDPPNPNWTVGKVVDREPIVPVPTMPPLMPPPPGGRVRGPILLTPPPPAPPMFHLSEVGYWPAVEPQPENLIVSTVSLLAPDIFPDEFCPVDPEIRALEEEYYGP